MPGSTLYITTPIYYPSGEPHLGHAYTTICADTLARFHRLAGDDTFFLTGTDEHGQKMVTEAARLGIEPAQLAQQMMSKFRGYFDEIGIAYDDFIRTSEERHAIRCRRSCAAWRRRAISTWAATAAGMTWGRRSSSPRRRPRPTTTRAPSAASR